MESLEIYRNDVIHRRATGSNSRSQPRSRGGSRGKARAYSESSRRNFCKFLNNIGPLKFMLTITYPETFPDDVNIIKKDLKSILNKIRKQGAEYLWVIEFQRRGAPHFHILLDRPVPTDSLAKLWSRRTAAPSTAVHLSPVQSWIGIRRYFTSPRKWCQQHLPPSWQEDLGRWWGHSRGLKAEPVKTIKGDTPENRDRVLTLARTARRIDRHRRARQRRDPGIFSRSTYGTGPAILQYAERLADESETSPAAEDNTIGDELDKH